MFSHDGSFIGGGAVSRPFAILCLRVGGWPVASAVRWSPVPSALSARGAFHAKLTVCSHTVGRGAGIMAAEKMTERKSGRKGSGAASWARVCRALSTKHDTTQRA